MSERVIFFDLKRRKEVLAKRRLWLTNMKSTGIVRKVDDLGRIVLPSSIRNNMDIKAEDAVEIFTEGDKIILQKYQPFCIFCNSGDDVVYYKGKRICAKCLEEIKGQL